MYFDHAYSFFTQSHLLDKFFFLFVYDFREKISPWWAGHSKWGGCVCSHHGGAGREGGVCPQSSLLD